MSSKNRRNGRVVSSSSDASFKREWKTEVTSATIPQNIATAKANSLLENLLQDDLVKVIHAQGTPSENDSLFARSKDEFNKKFIRNGVTIAGGVHLFGDAEGSGNQDYFGDAVSDNGIVAVVCDGCGSAPDSSTGARSGVRMIRAICLELLQSQEISPEEFARELQKKLVMRIRDAARINSGEKDIDNALCASYLFTVIIAVVTPRWYAVLRCGDGYFAVNGKVTELFPRSGNRPEYLAYLASDAIPVGFENITLEVVSTGDPKDLTSILIATDGCMPLFENRAHGIRIEDIWSDPQLRDEKILSARMNSVNTSRVLTISGPLSIGEIAKRAAKARLFSDDATLMVLLRRNAEDDQRVNVKPEKAKGDSKKPTGLIKIPNLSKAIHTSTQGPNISFKEVRDPAVSEPEPRESVDEHLCISIDLSLSTFAIEELREGRMRANLTLTPIKDRQQKRTLSERSPTLKLIRWLWRKVRRPLNR
jgi:hypothetical protein